jgi:tetratricopeptide (TPR) repeat protein
MQKGLLLILGLAVGSLVIGIYPTEFASAQRSPIEVKLRQLPPTLYSYSEEERNRIGEEIIRIYDDRGSEDRQRRRKRLYDLSRVGYSGGLRGYVSRLEAEQSLRQMIPIRKEFGDRRGEISDFMRIATIYSQRMRHREAVENFKIAIELARSNGDLRMEYQVLIREIGAGDLFEGIVPIPVCVYLIRRDSSFDWIPARLEYLKEKLNLSSPDPLLLEKIGGSYSARKEYLKAIEGYKKNIYGLNSLLNKGEKCYLCDFSSIAAIQLKMGLLYRLIGKEVEAEDAFNNSLDSYSKIGINRDYSNLLTTASIVKARADEREIWDNITTLAIAKKSDQLISKVIQARITRYNTRGYFVLKDIGDAYSRVGDYKTAINYYEQSLKSRSEREINYRDSPELALARAYANTGDKEASLKYYLLVYNNYYLQRPIFVDHFSASEFAQKTRTELYEIIGKKPTNLADGYGSLLLLEFGNFYKKIGEADKAINLYKQAADKLDNSLFVYGGWGGGSPQASILSDEDDVGKLITETSKDRKTETTNQDSKK